MVGDENMSPTGIRSAGAYPSPAGVRRLTLVRVDSSNCSFGMLSGKLDGTNIPVSLRLVENHKQRLLGDWPREGDIVGCDHVYHSVYEPQVLLMKDELEGQRLLHRLLPYDITDAYFSCRRPLVRVEA